MTDHIPHQCGGHGRVFRRTGEEYGLHIFAQHTVHIGNTLFILKIAYIADSSQDKLSIKLLAEINSQAFIRGY
ncbi:hypothetical protein D3C86_1965350 [compost metagenome]